MPDEVRAAAYVAARRREVGVPVANIAFDSVMEAGGTDEPGRRIRFEAPDCVVEIVVVIESGHLAWEITVTPPKRYDLVLRQDGKRSRRVAIDERGKARVSRAPRGVISILVKAVGSDAPIARTAWVPL